MDSVGDGDNNLFKVDSLLDGDGHGDSAAAAANSTQLLVNIATNLSQLVTYPTSNSTQTSNLDSIFIDQISQTKILASIVLFLMTLICGYLPVRIILKQNYIQYAMYAGGGVLMATAFCHLMPEMHDNYKSINSNNHLLMHENEDEQTSNSTNTVASNLVPEHNHDHEHDHGGHHEIPILEIVLCCGFFFMYIVELLMVRFVNNHTHEHPCDTTSGLSSSYSDGPLVIGYQNTAVHPDDEPPSIRQQQINNNNNNNVNNSNNNNNNNDHNNQDVTGSTTSVGGSTVNVGGHSSSTTGILATSGDHQYTVGITGRSHANYILSSTSGSISGKSIKSGSEFYKFIRGLLIVSAFAAHAIFDGVAIGSQGTVEKVWTIFTAISCHKLIIAAVVGLELFTATLNSHFWTLLHLSIFSIMSPIGIILVVVAQSSLNLNPNDPAMILLQSFATGTLLYIVFVEILQPKGDQIYEKNRLGKSISLIGGFALMVLVLTLLHEDHHD